MIDRFDSVDQLFNIGNKNQISKFWLARIWLMKECLSWSIDRNINLVSRRWYSLSMCMCVHRGVVWSVNDCRCSDRNKWCVLCHFSRHANFKLIKFDEKIHSVFFHLWSSMVNLYLILPMIILPYWCLGNNRFYRQKNSLHLLWCTTPTWSLSSSFIVTITSIFLHDWFDD